LLVKAEQTVARRARLAQAIAAMLCALVALLLFASAARAEHPVTALLGAVTTTTTHALEPVTGGSQSTDTPPAPASPAPSAPPPPPAATPTTTVAPVVDHAVAPSSGASAESSAAPTSADAVQVPTRAGAPTSHTAHVLGAPHSIARQLGERAAASVRRPVQVATASASTRIAALGASASGSQREAIPPTDRRVPTTGVAPVRTLIGNLASGVATRGLAATLGDATTRLESSLASTLARLGTLTPAASLLQPELTVTPTAPLPTGDFDSVGRASSIGSSVAAQPGTPPRTDALAQASTAITETPIEASGASSRTSQPVTGGRVAAAAGPRTSAPGEALATRTRSIVATSSAPATTRAAIGDSHARGASPSSPASAGGIGAGSSASGVAGGFGLSLSLALAALLVALAPYTLRRLRLAAARWRIAPLRLIPARPG
jgi:hypothetical protein